MRETPLPEGQLRGRFTVTRELLDATGAWLRRGSADKTENLVFWAGRETDGGAVLFAMVAAQCRREPQGVWVDEMAVADAAGTARRWGAGILAQVHTHPGVDVHHSGGDDRLVLMPFESMLSLVVPSYGRGGLDLDACGLHQFQDGRWVWIADVRPQQLRVVPPVLDGQE